MKAVPAIIHELQKLENTINHELDKFGNTIEREIITPIKHEIPDITHFVLGESSKVLSETANISTIGAVAGVLTASTTAVAAGPALLIGAGIGAGIGVLSAVGERVLYHLIDKKINPELTTEIETKDTNS